MDELREAFEDAWEESEGEETEAGTEERQDLEEAPQETSTTEDVDNEVRATETTPQEGAEANTPADKEIAQNVDANETETQTNEKAAKAPASWTPAAREAWSKVPPEAQAQIAKRESEMNRYMQNTADAKNFMKGFKQTIEPYHGQMMAAGVKDPMQVVGALLNNDNLLRNGDTHTKAELVASMITKFGVDIGTLDNLLSGESPQQQPQGNPHVQDMIRQEMAPFHQMIQQNQVAQQQQQYQVQQDAANEVQTFGQGNEFLPDVRMQMASLLDMAAQDGREMSMQEAYDIACHANPEISNVIKQREVLARSQQTQNKRNAASSVTGRPIGGGGSASHSNSLRDSIANAWNDDYS